jgi:AcrR family transcriptional regulator
MSTSSPRKPQKPIAAAAYHHGNLRVALLEAAGELLERQGPASLSLRAVARQLGVSHNAPYRHFASRDDLLGALATEGFRALAKATARARDAATADDDALNWMGLAYIDFALKNPARYRLMFGGAKGQSAELAESAKASFMQLQGPASGTRFGESPLAAVRAWAFLHGIADLLLDRQINATLMDGRTPLEFAALLLVGHSPR